MGWWGVCGLGVLKRPPQLARPAGSLPRGVWAARLGMIAVFSLPVFAWLSVFDNTIPPRVRTFRLLLTLAAMMLMGSLVFLKQHFLDLELIRLLRPSHQSPQKF